ncbi:BnaC08g20140D [Brassica napus]|uniref:(rape) hypothetical protein n=1 Tax=Brassica napus TaxID=3708 RepID=A0A078HJZ6_BRANA|nr:unnamed protein product [Brassica napus]CDY38840.1 BnaC08g20140D [Brassica napus]
MKLQDSIDEKAESNLLKRIKDIGDNIIASFDKESATRFLSLGIQENKIEMSGSPLRWRMSERIPCTSAMLSFRFIAFISCAESDSRSMSFKLCSLQNNRASRMASPSATSGEDTCPWGFFLLISNLSVFTVQPSPAFLSSFLQAASVRTMVAATKYSSAASWPEHGGPSDRRSGAEPEIQSATWINDSCRAETSRSSLDHLNNELERMKNENLLQPQNDNDSDTRFLDL